MNEASCIHTLLVSNIRCCMPNENAYEWECFTRKTRTICINYWNRIVNATVCSFLLFLLLLLSRLISFHHMCGQLNVNRKGSRCFYLHAHTHIVFCLIHIDISQKMCKKLHNQNTGNLLQKSARFKFIRISLFI